MGGLDAIPLVNTPVRVALRYCRGLNGWSSSASNDKPSVRKQPVDRLLLKIIDCGRPLLYNDEDEQRSFDSTCWLENLLIGR
jgi:hypothetical protein